MLYLYTDGGVILKNPSKLGGTWAWILVDELDNIIAQNSGYVLPNQIDHKGHTVTNNQTELLAVLYGLDGLKHDVSSVEIRSDSEITLGRVFKGYSFNNIPYWMIEKLRTERLRLDNFPSKYTLMDGHPTKEQVEKGIGKKGHMTSKWNVWCDKECGRQAQKFLAEHNQ